MDAFAGYGAVLDIRHSATVDEDGHYVLAVPL